MFDDNNDNSVGPFASDSGDSGSSSDSNAGAPDIGQNAPPAPVDNSILSGQSQPGSPAGMDVNGNPTMGADSAYPSSGSPAPTGGLNASGDTYTTAGAPQGPAVPQAQGQPSVWKQIVFGALAGAFAGGGTRGFGEGMAAGQEKVQQAQQQKVENAQRATQLQFESVKAADSHIAALNSARAADNENVEAQQRISDHADAAEELLEEHGITPKVSVQGDSPNATHAQAKGALQTLANQNGGTIPQVATTNKPDSTSADGKTHTTNVFSTSQQDVTNNPNGTLDIINKSRAVKGLPPMSQSDLQVAGGQLVKGNWRAGAAQIANDATSFFTAIPALSKGKNANEISAENAATSAHLQQQFDTYSQSPNADPKVVAALKTQMEAFNKTAENQRGKASMGESNTTLEQAPSKAETARQEDIAKQNTPGGQLAQAKTRADLIKTQVETNKIIADQNAKNASGTTWQPKVTADEKKKAELAENIAFNANEVNKIIARRPDIVGKVSGRITSVEQMIGNNDPDISALGTEIHNIAMANSGVHGFRSQEGVKETENLLLNNFKNGGTAVQGAMKASTDSVQTFIDNARPEDYKTHSKQGGAAFYYLGQSSQAQNDAAKVHKNIEDFAHKGSVNGQILYTDDNKTYYNADGTVYKGQK